MCGIVGYIGKEPAAPSLLGGLKRLEYRGYDSAGICVADGGQLHVAKAKGRLENLSEMTDGGRAEETLVRAMNGADPTLGMAADMGVIREEDDWR